MFKIDKDKMQMRALGENPKNYENIRKKNKHLQAEANKQMISMILKRAMLRRGSKIREKKRREAAQNNKLFKKKTKI